MAYSIIKTEQGANAGNGYYTEYLCESADDIATLPTEVETVALVRAVWPTSRVIRALDIF